MNPQVRHHHEIWSGTRANVPPESWVEPPLQLPPIQAPTTGVWSTGDPALTEIQMTDSAENVTGP